MATSSSSTVPQSSDGVSHFSSQTEMEMESAKALHWSQLDYSTTASEWSAESNFHYFAALKEDPKWGHFFRDFEALEVGEKISEGAQADIYEARNTRAGPFDLVVKVMKGDAPLQAFQAQWPIGMLSARSKYKRLFDLPLVAILGGTVLRDQRLRGRFAFVMRRRWGDLRLWIDRRMKEERSTAGPFPMDEAIDLMLSIAEDMDTLHNKHDIVHRDLKASNVLVWIGSGEVTSLHPLHKQVEKIGSVVADFECSVGVLGTRFWRAPEILRQLKDKVPRSKVLFTRASDVYSYGTTCYEIVTGCIPYDDFGGEDTISQILNGRRPELPYEIPRFVKNIIVGCWHSDPLKRLTFSDICMALNRSPSPSYLTVDIDNTFQSGASIMEVEQLIDSQSLTLLEVMEELLVMDLSVLKASELSSRGMITQCFEVTDWIGRKVAKDKSIANITMALSLALMKKWISERCLGISIDGNTVEKMYIVEVVAERSPGLLQELSRLLVAMNFRVHSAGCWTHARRVECVIYVEGARMGILLGELRHATEYFRKSSGRFKIIVQRVAAEEFSHLNRRLHNLKSMDLTLPRSSSNIRVHQRKESEEGSRSTEVVVCLEERSRLVDVSRTLGRMSYKICRARVDYPGPYQFLKAKAKNSEDIDVETLREDGSENMIHRILDIASERRCCGGDGQLIVSGPKEELHDDLMRSFRENDLVVTGGLVYREFGIVQSFPREDIVFFVTAKPAAEAVYYSSMLPI